jgi:hypothetical protein
MLAQLISRSLIFFMVLSILTCSDTGEPGHPTTAEIEKRMSRVSAAGQYGPLAEVLEGAPIERIDQMRLRVIAFAAEHNNLH